MPNHNNDKTNKCMKNRLLFQKTILKIMRISLYQVLMAIFFTTIAQAHKTIAQEILERKVSFQSNNQSVESILHKIEKVSEVQFMYNHQILMLSRKSLSMLKMRSLRRF